MFLYWTVWSILFGIGHTISLREGEDIIKKHLENFLNPEVNPCDNFYRHVCPTQIELEDTIYQQSFDAIDQIAREGWAKLKEKKGIKDLPPSPGNKNDKQRKIENFFNKATLYMGLLHKSNSKEMNMFDLTKKGEMYNEIKGVLTNETEGSESLYSNQMEEQWLKVLSEFSLALGMEGDTDKTLCKLYDAYVDAQSKIDKVTRAISTLNLGPLEYEIVGPAIGAIKEAIYDTIQPDERKAVLTYDKLASVNREHPNNMKIALNEAQIVGALAKDLPKSAVYGIVGSSVARKMLRRYNVPATDPNNRMGCIRGHAKKMCDLHREEDCYNPSLVIEHTANVMADVEGAQIAYRAFEKNMKEDRLKVAYNGTGITHDQLFFYSIAASMCYPFKMSQMGAYEAVSDYVRVNAAFSLMEEFKTAFNCPKFAIMDQSDPNCNIIGTTASHKQDNLENSRH